MKEAASVSNHIAATLPPTWMSEAAAAQYLGVSARTIRDWRLHNGLPYFRPTHKTVLLSRAELDKWIERSRVAITR